MKIIIFNAHIIDSLGGSEMQCDLIAQGLSKKGHDVVYASVGKFRLSKYPDSLYKILPLDITSREEVFDFLKKEKPNIIYWRYNRKQLNYVIEAKLKLKIPFVFAVSGLHDATPITAKGYSSQSGLKGLPRRLVRYYRSFQNLQLIKKVDAVTVLNGQLLNKLPVKEQVTIWNATTLSVEEFEWGNPFVLWVANIKAIKRPEIYLNLAKEYSRREIPLDFLMVGDIHEKVPYLELIEQAKTLGNFHFLGKLSPEKVNGILKNAVCLVHTCEPEGFGNNFIQSWLQKCPTISLQHDPDGLIIQENLGFISKTEEQLAKDVMTLFENNNLRNSMGERAQIFALKNFTPDALTERVESYLYSILNKVSTGAKVVA